MLKLSKNKSKLKGAFIFFLLGVLSFTSPIKVEKLNLGNPQNCYKLNADLYRSAQPNAAGMKNLEKLGIKSILNLRQFHDDRDEAKATSLQLIHYPMNAWTLSEEEIIQGVRLLKSAPKPVLVHCKHGSDRTGAVIAAYRMLVQNWDKQKAIQEFVSQKYGYHEKWFPKIKTLLEAMNVKQLKAKL